VTGPEADARDCAARPARLRRIGTEPTGPVRSKRACTERVSDELRMYATHRASIAHFLALRATGSYRANRRQRPSDGVPSSVRALRGDSTQPNLVSSDRSRSVPSPPAASRRLGQSLVGSGGVRLELLSVGRDLHQPSRLQVLRGCRPGAISSKRSTRPEADVEVWRPNATGIQPSIKSRRLKLAATPLVGRSAATSRRATRGQLPSGNARRDEK